MFRRGIIRIGIGLVVAASSLAMALLWRKAPAPSMPLEPPPPAMLLDAPQCLTSMPALDCESWITADCSPDPEFSCTCCCYEEHPVTGYFDRPDVASDPCAGGWAVGPSAAGASVYTIVGRKKDAQTCSEDNDWPIDCETAEPMEERSACFDTVCEITFSEDPSNPPGVVDWEPAWNYCNLLCYRPLKPRHFQFHAVMDDCGYAEDSDPANDDLPVCPHCGGPDDLRVPEKLCPGEETIVSVTIPPVTPLDAPEGYVTCVTWSVSVGREHVDIEPIGDPPYSSARVRLHENAPKDLPCIIIKAADSLFPDCFIEAPIAFGCGGCGSGSCGLGGADFDVTTCPQPKDLQRTCLTEDDGNELACGFFGAIPLGNLANGKSAGSVRISASTAWDLALTPYGLRTEIQNDDILVAKRSFKFRLDTDTGFRDDNPLQVIRQVRAPQVLVDVELPIGFDWEDPETLVGANTAYGTSAWTLHVYAAPEDGDWSPYEDADLIDPAPGGSTPALVELASYAFSRSANVFSITKTVDSTDTEYTLTYVAPSGYDAGWKLETDTLRTKEVYWKYNSGPAEWQVFEVLSQDGGEIGKTERTYKRLTWGNPLVELIRDPDGAAITTTYDYYSSGTSEGLLKLVTTSDGSWSGYKYDSAGRVTVELTPWLDGIPPSLSDDFATFDGLRTLYSYPSNVSGTDWGAITRPSSVTREVQTTDGSTTTTVIEKTDYEYTWYTASIRPKPWLSASTTKRYPDPSTSGTIDTSYTYETGWADDPNMPVAAAEPENRVLTMTAPDGQTTAYDWANSGSLTGSSFTETGGTRIFTTVTENSQAPADGKSLRRHAVYDALGRKVFDDTQVSDSSSWATIGWNLTTYDSHGHVSQLDHSNNTYETYNSGCCGLISSTNALGVETDYVRDLLGRATTTTVIHAGGGTGTGGTLNDIDTVLSFAIDMDVHAYRTITTVDDGTTTPLMTKEWVDKLGRTVQSADAAGIVTNYSYVDDITLADRSVTVQRPAGATETTSYYRDGHTKSVVFDGVTLEDGMTPMPPPATCYHYEVNSDGTQTTTVYTVPDPTHDTSDRWVKTTTDPLGRTILEERPASGDPDHNVQTQYSYDATTGKLMSVKQVYNSTQLYAATVYKYDDETGKLQRTGLDVNDDGDIDLDDDPDDRINETETLYIYSGSAWWEQATHYVYKDGTNTPVTMGIERKKLTGLASGVIDYRELTDAFSEVTTVTSTLTRASARVDEVTDYPATSNNGTRITIGGKLRSQTDKAQLTTTFDYDTLGRQKRVTDPRSNWVERAYDSYGRLYTAQSRDGAEAGTAYVDATYTYDAYGRVSAVENAQHKFTRTDYDQADRPLHTWGDVPQPVTITYDAYGQRETLSTYRSDPGSGHDWSDSSWPSPAPSPDTTTWSYEDSTGLLTGKTYADGKGPIYGYTADGRLSTRTWARDPNTPIVTTYSYDTVSSTWAKGTGDLKKIAYSDSTPTIDFAYTRFGQLYTADDAVGRRTFAYDAQLNRDTETFSAHPSTSAFLYGSRTIKSVLADTVLYNQPGVGITTHYFPRLSRVSFGPPASPTSEYDVSYDYDQDKDRMITVTGPGLPSSGAQYTYLANSNLVNHVKYMQSFTTKADRIYSYETKRNLLTSVENKVSGVTATPTMSKYEYINDSLGRRTSCVRTGEAFSGTTGAGGISPNPNNDTWHYDDRNELDTTHHFEGTGAGTAGSGTADTTLDRDYDYDPIGNRTDYTEGTASPLYYCTNNLNQYDATGSAAGCSSPTESFGYDLDGNLKQDGTYDFEWDAENRLTLVTPRSPTSGSKQVAFKYDYLGRRVEKSVFIYTTSWPSTPDEVRRYIWYNWLMIAELDNSSTPAVLKRYTWGLDLAGQAGSVNSIEGAGGIGGLLSVYDYNGASADLKYAYAYDANGNVGQVLDYTATTVANAVTAKYEYDAYGNVTASGGTYAATNPWRFSTKQFDAVTGLGYWGSRYFSAKVGRWTSRPTAIGSATLPSYEYSDNSPSTHTDQFPTVVLVSGIDPTNLDPNPQNPTDYLNVCGLGSQVGKDSKCGSHVTLGGFLSGGILDIKGYLEADAERNKACVRDKIRCTQCPCDHQKSIGIVMLAPKTTHAPQINCKCCKLTFLILFDHEDIVANGSQWPWDPGNTMFGNSFWKNNFTAGNCVSGRAFDVDFRDLPSHGSSAQPGGGVSSGEVTEVHPHGGIWSGFNPPISICSEIAKIRGDTDQLIVCHSQGCNIVMHAINEACNHK